MKIAIFAIGKLKEKHWVLAQCEYQKRIVSPFYTQLYEVKDEKDLLRQLPPKAHTVLCDESGDCWSSQELTDLLTHQPSVAFVVGGPDGFSDRLRKIAHARLAFGRVTLAHDLARVILWEQLYRAQTIFLGGPYHRK